MTNEKLIELRNLIDRADSSLLEALKERFELTYKVGELKALHNLPTRDIKREKEKLDRLSEQWIMQNPNADFIRKLFSMIMAESRKNHKRLKNTQK
jgi:chorismate mutase